MNLGSVTRYLEGEVIDEGGKDKESKVAKLPSRFIERFVLKGIKVDLIEPGRIVCSMKVQPHLLVKYLFYNFFYKNLILRFNFGIFWFVEERTQENSYTEEQWRQWWI